MELPQPALNPEIIPALTVHSSVLRWLIFHHWNKVVAMVCIIGVTVIILVLAALCAHISVVYVQTGKLYLS